MQCLGRGLAECDFTDLFIDFLIAFFIVTTTHALLSMLTIPAIRRNAGDCKVAQVRAFV
eukprot:COSAG06_NODE_8754_length_2078_cov_2.716523_1_plen_58_part_10